MSPAGRLGFGAARLMAGPERRASQRLVEAALERGIRHFDTAPSYGGGESEAVLGEVLAGVPDVTVVTKVGIARPEPGQVGLAHRLYRRWGKPLLALAPGLKARLLPSAAPDANRFASRRVLGMAEIERSLDESRRLLRRDPDVLLLHEPAQFILDAALEDRLRDVVLSGRAKRFGVGTGGELAPGDRLGDVWQMRWTGHAGEAKAPTMVFHGVLRGSRSHAEARERLREARRGAPDAVILLSFSRASQLDALLEP